MHTDEYSGKHLCEPQNSSALDRVAATEAGVTGDVRIFPAL